MPNLGKCVYSKIKIRKNPKFLVVFSFPSSLPPTQNVHKEDRFFGYQEFSLC